MLLGLLFGVFLALGMMIVLFLFEMFVGNSAVEALQVIIDSGWLCAFGLAMTVVMYLAGRK